jgi:hypothetical protein
MRWLLAAAVAPLLFAPTVLGAGQAKVQKCSAILVNYSGRTLQLKKASSLPAWSPGFHPQPAPSIEDNSAVYWWTDGGSRGCWNHVVYRSGRRVVELTVDGRAGHRRSARCRQSGFQRCRILLRTIRPPTLYLSVRLS